MTPVLMIIHCPYCKGQHVDREEWATLAKAHLTHLCEHCGNKFRLVEFHTIGVEKLACVSCGGSELTNAAQITTPTGRIQLVCKGCFDGLEKSLYAGAFIQQTLNISLELAPGGFYRALNDDVWCCYKVEPKERDAYQAWCVRLKDGLSEHFFFDGRHEKAKEYWLVSTVSSAGVLRSAATWIDKGQASPL